MTGTPFSIERLTPSIGAEISGLDLSGPLDGATLDAVYRALLDHLVLFFRDQTMPPAAHLAFAESFGEIDRPHPVYPHAGDDPRVMLLAHGANPAMRKACRSTDARKSSMAGRSIRMYFLK